MRRREFIRLLWGAAATPFLARAGDARSVPRIGVLFPGTPTTFALRAGALLRGLADIGYVDGKTITIEWRWAEDRVERLPELATELVKLNIDVFVTNGTPATKALKNATKVIPIVMAGVGDPVGTGLVDNLARPGGNVTGNSVVSPDLSGKRLELLAEAVPGVRRVYVIRAPENPINDLEFQQMQVSARKLGLQPNPIQISDPNKLEDAFATLTHDNDQAVIFLTDEYSIVGDAKALGLTIPHSLLSRADELIDS